MSETNDGGSTERADGLDLPDSSVFWRWVRASVRPYAGWIMVGGGALLLLIGYLGVSREALVAKQIPYLLSGGLGGLVLVFLGAFFLGSEDLRVHLRRLDRIEEMVEQLHGALLAVRDDATPVNGQGRPPSPDAEADADVAATPATGRARTSRRRSSPRSSSRA